MREETNLTPLPSPSRPLRRIVARSLVVNLAFPQIWDAISEFVGSENLSPKVEFFESEVLGILGKTVSFGAVQHILMKLYNGSCVGIGYYLGSTMRLVVSPGTKVDWTAAPRVIVIIRRFNFDELYAPGELDGVGSPEEQRAREKKARKAELELELSASKKEVKIGSSI